MKIANMNEHIAMIKFVAVKTILPSFINVYRERETSIGEARIINILNVAFIVYILCLFSIFLKLKKLLENQIQFCSSTNMRIKISR